MQFFIVLFLTILSAQVPIKCNLISVETSNIETIRQNPPQTDTSIISATGFFRIYFDSTGTDAPELTDLNGNGISDYVDEVAVMADSARKVLVDIMGFLPVPGQDEAPYPIYISNRDPYNYGLNTNGGWIEIDNNYSQGFYTLGLQAMRVTIAHEYFHAVQRKYRDLSNENRYFYEFSSTWIEDIIIPDGNDYLFWLDGPNRIWTYPEIAFSETDGYSVAFYGHYLNTIVEEIEIGMESNLVREIWEKIGNTNLTFSSCINSILNDYNYSFIESWTDFIARNHYNSRNPDFYYHPDLENVDPIGIGASTIYEYLTESMNLYSNKASLSAYVVYYDGILNIDHHNSDMSGRIVILGENLDDDALFSPSEIMNIPLYKDVDKMTFIYGAQSNENIEIDFFLSRKPYPPAVFNGYAESERIILTWSPSLSSEDILNYYIYRNGKILDSIPDTTYIDSNIEPVTQFTYQVTAVNPNGESDFSNEVHITSWPKDDSVEINKIVSIYPNPIKLTNVNNMFMILDSSSDFSSPEIKLFDITGRNKSFLFPISFKKGRQRLIINRLFDESFSSGWYMLQVKFESEKFDHIPVILVK